VIIVSSIGLFDYTELRELYATSRLEFGVSLTAMLDVLIIGVLSGVVLAVGLSLAWLLYASSRPPEAVLGRIPHFRSLDTPKAEGKLVFLQSSSICFILQFLQIS
jgi:MFS superfamily sulfate permease-like transporter